MPKRPKSHIINSISEKKFLGLVPDEWVCRKLNEDYGIDFEIEIFDNEEATGQVFYVQLKGTEKTHENDKISIQLSSDTLEYYQKLILPVLLVVIHTSEDVSWATWVNDIEIGDSGSKLIKLGSEKIIDSVKFAGLSGDIEIEESGSVYLELNAEGNHSIKFSERIKEYLELIYNGNLKSENRYASSKLTIDVKDIDDGLDVSISFRDRGMHFVTEYDESSIDYDLTVKSRVIRDGYIDVFYVISLILKDKYEDISYILYSDTFLKASREVVEMEHLLQMLLLLSRRKQLIHIKSLFDAAITAERFDFASTINTMILLMANGKLTKLLYSDNLKIIESIENDNFSMSMNLYNQANFHMTSNNPRKAVKLYISAARISEHYKYTDYFWRELGGVLYVLKHYHFAEMFYKKAIRLGSSEHYGPIVYALTADCMIRRYKFAEAKDMLKEYFSHDGKSAEYILRDRFLEIMKQQEHKGIKIDKLKSEKLSTKASELMPNGDLKSYTLNSQAIAVDPLNTLAWFNLGMYYNSHNQYQEAAIAFTCVVALQYDIEACALALVSYMNIKPNRDEIDNETFMITVLINYVVEIWGEDSIDEIGRVLVEKGRVDSKEVIPLIQAFRACRNVVTE